MQKIIGLQWYYVLLVVICIIMLCMLIIILCIRKWSNDSIFVHTPYCNRNIENNYAIVTGANRGLGRAVTKLLVQRGCNVILCCRNEEKASYAIQSITNELNSNKSDHDNYEAIQQFGEMQFIKCDLSSFESIDSFIDKYKSLQYPLHIIINNAAINPPKTLQHINGIETNFAVDYFGHVYLTHKLFNIMKQSTNNNQYNGRIVTIASKVANWSINWNQFVVNNINYQLSNNQKHVFNQQDIDNVFNNNQIKNEYNSFKQYASVKLAQCLWMKTFNEMLMDINCFNIQVCAVHPGLVDTGADARKQQKCCRRCWSFSFGWFRKLCMLSPEDGANGILHCVLCNGNESENVFLSGGYHSNCRLYPIMYGKKPEEELNEIQQRLWNITQRSLGIDLTLH
eukprot:77746_1